MSSNSRQQEGLEATYAANDSNGCIQDDNSFQENTTLTSECGVSSSSNDIFEDTCSKAGAITLGFTQSDIQHEQVEKQCTVDLPKDVGEVTFCWGDNGCPPHGFVCYCGRRKEMEDAVMTVPKLVSLPCVIKEQDLDSQELGGNSDAHFFGVYDGHGGSQAAVFCKERLHLALIEELKASSSLEYSSEISILDSYWRKVMVDCFSKVDAEIGGICLKGENCEKCKGEGGCMMPKADETVGSTAIIAIVNCCHIVVANCGDSRAVLSRGGRAIALSNDHKPEREDELERIEAAGGRVIPWNGYRVFGVLAMSRALGDRYLKPYVIAEPEVTCMRRLDDDEFLILASDGLWDVFSNEAACEIARMCLAGRGNSNVVNSFPSGNVHGYGEAPATVAAAFLTRLAYHRGSSDNISVVVVDLKKRNQ